MIYGDFDREIDLINAPPPLGVQDWARKYRRLGSEYSAAQGRFNPDITPYFNGIAEAYDSGKYEQIVVISASQCAKTTFLENIIGRDAHMSPAPIMIVFPEDGLATEFGMGRLDKMIRSTPELSDVFVEKGARSKGDKGGGQAKATTRSYLGGVVEISSARSPSDLRSRPIRTLLMDEVSLYPATTGKSGDPVSLALDRTVTFGTDKRILLVSTPEDESFCRITAAFRQGTQMGYQLPCPHCGDWAEFTWERLSKSRETAQMPCEECGCLLDEGDKISMLPKGRWVTRRNENTPDPLDPTIASFHVTGLLSPWRTWEEVVRRHAMAKADGDLEKMKAWTTSVLGEPWYDQSSQLNPEILQGTMETDDRVPDERIVAITGSVDVQSGGSKGARLEMVLMGWDEKERGFGLEYRTFKGGVEAADTPPWLELAEFVREYIVEVGDGRRLRIDALAVDTGHLPSTVYHWCANMGFRNGLRIMPMRGSSDLGAKIAANRTNINSTTPAPAKLYWHGSQNTKHLIAARSRAPKGSPGTFTFPDHIFGASWYRGLAAEKLVSSKSRGKFVRKWEQTSKSRSNEPIDLLAMSICALHHLSNPRKLLDRRERARQKWLSLPDSAEARKRIREAADAAKAAGEDAAVEKYERSETAVTEEHIEVSAEQKAKRRQDAEGSPDDAPVAEPLPHHRRQSRRRRNPNRRRRGPR